MKLLSYPARGASVTVPLRVFIVMVLFATAQAQDVIPSYTARIWTQRDGLPSNEITGLHQSSGGYLFVGTPDGMVRFDGSTFTPVLPAMGDSSRQRGFVAVVEDPADGSLLIAPRSGGLVRLSGNTVSEVPLPLEHADTPVEALQFEDDHTLWIGLKGGTVLLRSRTETRSFGPAEGILATERIQFARAAGGAMWIASGTFLARYENGAFVRVPIGNGTERLRIAPARVDGPWILADEHLVKVEGGKLHPLNKVNGTTAAYYNQAILEDSAGNLWMGSRSRGLRMQDLALQNHTVVQVPEDITALIEDDLGNIWAGSNGGGLIRVSRGVLKVHDRASGLMETHSPAVCQDSTGRMWFANRDGGIAWLNENGRTAFLQKPRPWDKFSVVSVSPNKEGGVWASTTYGLVRATVKGMQSLAYTRASAGTGVMATARNGDLWVALNPSGVARVRSTGEVDMEADDAASKALVRTIAEDPEGAIWLGCEDGSLLRFDGTRFSLVEQLHPLSAGPIQAMYFDEKGACWIGTERSGLYRRNSAGTRRIGSSEGLLSDNITQVLSDHEGALWLGSPTGIFHVGIDELDGFFAGTRSRIWPVVIGADDGLSEATCLGAHQPSAWRSSNGLLWFATRQGIVAIDPRRERGVRTALQTRIVAVRVDGKEHAAVSPFRIRPGARNIEIQFSPLCLASPGDVRTRHRLVDLDNDWVEADSRNVARYSRLTPGRYQFEVTSFLTGRAGTDSRAALVLEVQAAWWQTSWFKLIVSLLVTALVAALARAWSHRRLHQKLARLEHDSALERERTRIARNIHDDLGAGLTRISLLTQSAHNGSAEGQLDRIYETTCSLTQSMDEIVWAVNPKNDDLENVAGYIGEFAQGYMADAGLSCRVLIPDVLPVRTVTAQFRHHLFLACKEALNNVIKHAQARNVTVQFEIADDLLTVTVSDDGIGMGASSSISYLHDGLANMRSRMESIGGTMSLQAGRPTGTVVILTASLTEGPKTS